MSLDTIVDVTITSTTKTPSRVGFGTPMVLAYVPTSIFSERVKAYTDPADMITDGFAATDRAYLAVSKLLGQNPAPSSVLVGREENTDNMDISISPISTNLRPLHAYTVYVAGQAATYTSGATPAVADIVAGLKTAIDALSITGILTTDNTTYLQVQSSGAEYNYAVYADDYTILDIQDDTLDMGITADFAAIRAENDDFYSVHPTLQSKSVITTLAAIVETLKKIMIVDSPDSEIRNSSSTTDVAATLQASAYARTALIHHPKSLAQFPAAAWAGKMLPKDPGSATWKFKTLAGPTYVDLGATPLSNVEAKDCNVYIRVGGINMTQQGVTAAGEFIDITRGIDWIEARMQEYVFWLLANADKVPYTDAGVAQVQAQVQAVLNLAMTRDVLARDPAPTVTVPKVADVSATDKANRLLPDMKFTGTLAGAIHKVVINGTISV